MSVPGRDGSRDIDVVERHPDYKVYKSTGGFAGAHGHAAQQWIGRRVAGQKYGW